ncbi:M15 family metallopeptidase [Fervidobacterium pennivorans subsp. shakshaketiis]|jgi:peptidoglycan L-alanyl-D-glutamate endopeptidase CwlK|uniref:D-alanyl-D-alanine carboxypeptidase n=1 Tax=Fervidobacterium pennivorans (strain DSM 9078 / Ven5) TaxID=771875 RepID=H9UDK3_FERPD|nr:M15 family metallopeptidase [Fervidobacterium pennivorans]AFG35596.1 D-alanyl-D-alanine carboxypeptidase [Fervidobacterium pennivorans DSM 9078]QIV78781.1 M15 family metallopeptidase [Fervidobacterium pennivorans subsp. keratinolyticus]
MRVPNGVLKIVFVVILFFFLLLPVSLESYRWEIRLEIGLSNLNYQFRRYVEKFVMECSKEGISVWIYNTYRSRAVQNALYAQGREPLEVVNLLRQKAKLEPIDERKNRYVVTKLRVSAHNYGLAADFVPVVDGKPQWYNDELWLRCGYIALNLGMEWGGMWKGLVDKPHIQMKNWRKVATFNHLERLIIE